MYKFRDLNKTSVTNSYIPSVAMEIDGKTIEERIPGFTTLNVSGRELANINISTVGDVTGLDGTVITNRNYQPRYITIDYLLEAKTNEEFREKFNLLNHLLNSLFMEPKEVRFKDELNWYWSLDLYEVLDVEVNSNVLRSSIVFISQKPYKYSSIITSSQTQIASDVYNYEINIESIRVTTGNLGTSPLKFINQRTGRQIVINNTGGAINNKTIQILPNVLLVSGQNRMDLLDITTSDWNKFKLIQGDTVTISPSTNISNYSIKYRRVRL